MSSPVLEDIAHTNLNIIIDIYKLLNFGDQLRLSRASHWLKEIFNNYIWKQNYRTLEISNIFRNFGVSNETNENRLNLGPEEFSEFLSVYANEVHQLIELRDYVSSIGQFRNLRNLNLGRRLIDRSYLAYVAEYCLNLESLQVHLFGNKFCLFGGNDLDIRCLLNLKHLKSLTLKTNGFYIEYVYFRDIVTELQLECFILEAVIWPRNDAAQLSNIKVAESKSLKELGIVISDAYFFDRHFNVFENLLKLNLQFDHVSLDKNVWATLYKFARHLDALTIQKTNISCDLGNLPPTLKELNLCSCSGLTYDHLYHILSHSNLTKFSSLKTEYAIRRVGSINFRIPPLLQSLNCQHINTVDFKSAYDGHKYLKELTWYDYNNYAVLPADNLLSTCSALTTLCIEEGWISLDSVLQMRHIRKLTIHTAVLKINSYVLIMAIDFWLDLFCQNFSTLKLICSGVSDYALKKIITNSNFPRELKTINCWGYTVDCNDLRTNFEQTTKKCESDILLKRSFITLCGRKNLATE